MSVRLTFHGAARTVTGSKYLVEHNLTSILIDAGLFQGKKELRLRNWETPPFDLKSLTAIVLTHAHIDHTGFLPVLAKYGYKGPVYCTEPTAELLKLLLPDSAHLQEEEAKFANRHGTSKHHPAKPLYDGNDAQAALSLLKTFGRDKPTAVAKDVTVTARCAGHILGATSLNLDIGGKRITFSGDIGRCDAPVLPDPCPMEIGDLLLCESTYGDRLHEAWDVKEQLAGIVRATKDRNGALVVPAFAVGRTQTLLYYLAELEQEGRIPILPIFVDSPMAVDATALYRKFKYDYDDEAAAIEKSGRSPFVTRKLKFCRSVEDSKALNTMKGARIIIAASGMANGGRIMHHLKNWLPYEETTVLFVGFQAEGTRGAIIQSGAEYIRIFGQNIPIRANVESLPGLSAHGDRDELIRWLRSCSGSPKSVRIVHGEEPTATAFAKTVQAELGWKSEVANHLETVEV